MDFDKITAAMAVLARAIDEGLIKPVMCPKRAWIVLRHPKSLSDESITRLERHTSDAFGGRRVVILEESMDITVIDEPVEKTVREETL